MLSIGDHVRPKPQWLKGPDSVPMLPSGRVNSVEPWGQGQIVRIENSTRRWFAGMFDKVEG